MFEIAVNNFFKNLFRTLSQQQQLKNRCHSKLLQRRGSNTSLTLNIQGSSNSLNRFCSHNSLNILQQEKRKGLLERRDSNTSLTLNIGKKALSVSNCALQGGYSTSSLSNVHDQEISQGFDACDHPDGPTGAAATNPAADRRFYSSENLTHLSIWSKYSSNCSSRDNHDTPYGSVDDFKRRTIVKDIDIDDEWTTEGAVEATQSRNITTKPLSPQSTSEDFKIYLANIQFLQNASNVLTEKQLATLNDIFQKSYNAKVEESNPVQPILDHSLFMTKEQQIEEEDQKRTLIKLHQVSEV